MPYQPKLSFAKDIRSMFTDLDVAHMGPLGIDLSSRDDVADHADSIYSTVSSGSMPPESSGEARWTQDMCARFKLWQTQGCPP
jgi:hypothetical protein